MNRRALVTAATVAVAASVAVAVALSRSSRDTADASHRHVASVVAAYFAGPAAAFYAGSYLDDEGTTVVLVTREAERVRADLVSRVGPGERLDVRPARFSLADLDRIVDALTARLDSIRASGAAVTSVAVDEQANRVVVGLREDSTATREAVLSALSGSDRPAVTFEVTSANVLE